MKLSTTLVLCFLLTFCFGNEEFLKELQQQNSHRVKTLLSQDDSLANQRFADRDTPLHISARLGNEEIIKALLEAGANVNAQNEKGETPLHCAIVADQAAIVRMLLNEK